MRLTSADGFSGQVDLDFTDSYADLTRLRREIVVSGFERVIDSLRKGRDYDVYVTIVVAITVSVLSFFDIMSTQKISGLLLAVLAILAYNILATRAAVEDRKDSTKKSPAFFSDFSSDLIARRATSHDVYIIGVSKSRTIETSYIDFQRTLRHGGRIRILLADPDADESALAAQEQASRPTLEDVRNEIRQSLGKLRSLAASAASTGSGKIEVRTTRSALKFGLNYLDIGQASATLYVQLYSFRLPGESRPMFELTSADGEWFECYRHQAEALWAEGTDLPLLPGAKTEERAS
jgi:hypothetical protein